MLLPIYQRRIVADAGGRVKTLFRLFSGQISEFFGRWRTTMYSSMADGVGFEPTVSLHPRRFSRPVP
jgi:hypothetical protein